MSEHAINFGDLSFRVSPDSSFATCEIDTPFILEIKKEKYTVKVFRKTYYGDSFVIDAQLFDYEKMINLDDMDNPELFMSNAIDKQHPEPLNIGEDITIKIKGNKYCGVVSGTRYVDGVGYFYTLFIAPEYLKKQLDIELCNPLQA